MMRSSPTIDVTSDKHLALICEEISDRLRSGQPVDLEEYAAQWPAHAEELRRLLPAMQALMELPSVQPQGTEPSEGLSPLQPLGDFRIVRQIGRGGMGVVYEAQQLSLGRKVALKVLPLASVLDPRQLARFKNEAMAAAGLNHPHIVPVYAIGEERGVHYYAMQFIDGQDLAEIVSELRVQEGLDPSVTPKDSPPTDSLASQLSRGPPQVTSSLAETADQQVAVTRRSGTRRSQLSAYCRNVARIIRNAAEALASAHEEGVIHRDIKPSNLIIDSRGKIWVADFGLAQMRGSSALTMTGDLLGTLRYMSPEQAAGKRIPIDHRTDIYSLGATLYEVLTLRPMFSGDAQAELLRQIATEEPITPRRLRPGIELDLETIALKATAKLSPDRYASMRDMVEDLDRYLRNEPIKAKPIGPLERLARHVRRNSLTLAASLAMTVLLTVVLGIAFGMTYLARNDALARGKEAAAKAKEAEAKGNELQKQHQQTMLLLGRVNRAVDTMLDRLSSLPAGDAVRQAIAEEELAFYRELKATGGPGSAASSQLAQSLHRLGHLQIDQGKQSEAQVTLKKAIDIFEELERTEPHLAMHANSLCHAWMNYGRAALAEQKLDLAVERMTKSLEYGSKASKLEPGNPEYRLGLAFPWGQIGVIRGMQNRYEESFDAHRREIELHAQNVAAHPDRWQYHLVLSAAHWTYGTNLHRSGYQKGAKANYKKSLEHLRVIEKERPDDALVQLRIFVAIASLFSIGGELSEEESNTLYSRIELQGEQPMWDPNVENSMAWKLCRSPKTSTRECRLAATLAKRCVAARPDQHEFWNTLGLAHYRCGNFADSLIALEKSRALRPSSFGIHNAFFEAMCYQQLDQHDRAVARFLNAKDWMEKNASNNDELRQFRDEVAELLGIKDAVGGKGTF